MNRLRPGISLWVAVAQNRETTVPVMRPRGVATVIERSFHLHPLQDIPAATNLGLMEKNK